MKKVRALDALKEAGNTAFKEQRTEEAIEKYSEAISFDEENETMRSILLSNRAAAYLRVRSILSLSLSLSLSPSRNRLSYSCFDVIVQLKQYDSAISDCTTCLSLNSSYFKALRTRARSYLAQEEFEDAVRDFKAAFELAPSGSNDESMLKKEVREAEQKLKKSKMKVRSLSPRYCISVRVVADDCEFSSLSFFSFGLSLQDHYKILGVSSDASEVEIKKGYRKMSLQFHPDKGGSDEKFQEVSYSFVSVTSIIG